MEPETVAPEGAQHTDPPEAERTFTQADVDRIVADRLKREDVKGLKVKASELDTSKSEIQRLADEVAALTKARLEESAKALRYRVATEAGLSSEDADLFLTGSDEETITAQAKRLAERNRPSGGRAPNEGKQPTNTADPMRSFARSLFATTD